MTFATGSTSVVRGLLAGAAIAAAAVSIGAHAQTRNDPRSGGAVGTPQPTTKTIPADDGGYASPQQQRTMPGDGTGPNGEGGGANGSSGYVGPGGAAGTGAGNGRSPGATGSGGGGAGSSGY